jgi:hypothetical protein
MDKIIQDGTILTIDSEFTQSVEEALDEGIITHRQYEVWCHAIYDKWIPRQIHFFHNRTDRKSVYLAWSFLDEDLASVPHYNLTIFRKLGYKIIEPEQVEIDLFDADDDLLDEEDLILKHIVLQNYPNYPTHYRNRKETDNAMRSWAEGIMKIVKNAMKENGIIFYRP